MLSQQYAQELSAVRERVREGDSRSDLPQPSNPIAEGRPAPLSSIFTPGPERNVGFNRGAMQTSQDDAHLSSQRGASSMDQTNERNIAGENISKSTSKKTKFCCFLLGSFVTVAIISAVLVILSEVGTKVLNFEQIYKSNDDESDGPAYGITSMMNIDNLTSMIQQGSTSPVPIAQSTFSNLSNTMSSTTSSMLNMLNMSSAQP